MKNRVRESTTFMKKGSSDNSSNSGTTCPKCGGKMVASAHQVVAKYPAPALERQVCEESSCNYSRFVKLNTETGLTSTGVRSGELK